MATDNTAFQYDSILRGEFFQDIAEDVIDEVDGDGDGDDDGDGEDDVDDATGTPTASPRPKRVSAQPQPDKTEASDWIPELKKVVQLTGDDGYTHIIGLESYTPAARPSRKDDEDEKQPFEEYAVLLKAVIERYEKRARFQLELQSEGLRDIFRTIATPYREVNLETTPIVIDYPFRCLFFLRGKLKALSLAPETDESTRKALGLLVDFIHSPMGHQRLIDAYNELVPNGKITFPMLWTIFPPFEPVLFQDSAEKESKGMGCILESVEFEEKEDEKPTWNLNFLCGYHDGNRFHVKRDIHAVDYFPGMVEISLQNLLVIPFHLIEEKQRLELRAAFIERGKKYIEYCKNDYSFLHYKGPASLTVGDCERRLVDLDSAFEVRKRRLSCYRLIVF